MLAKIVNAEFAKRAANTKRGIAKTNGNSETRWREDALRNHAQSRKGEGASATKTRAGHEKFQHGCGTRK